MWYSPQRQSIQNKICGKINGASFCLSQVDKEVYQSRELEYWQNFDPNQNAQLSQDYEKFFLCKRCMQADRLFALMGYNRGQSKTLEENEELKVYLNAMKLELGVQKAEICLHKVKNRDLQANANQN